MIGLVTEWMDADGSKKTRDEHTDLGGTMRLGAQLCQLEEDTLARKVYEKPQIIERHRHRYEVNNKFVEALEKAWFNYFRRSADNTLVEMIELPDHPWFLACQFHPEFTSTPRDGHPLFKQFYLQHANKHQEEG